MTSSRIARREQQKLVKQTIWFAAAAIGLFLLFIFIVLPQVVRFAGNMLDKNNPFVETDTIPPQPPVIVAPVSATFSARLAVKGVGEPKAEVVLVINSNEVGRADISDEGEFDFELPLTEGENALTLFSVDEAGNESVKSQNYKIILDTEAPTIEIEQPQHGQAIELRQNQTTEIRGKTEPHAKVFVNDRLIYASAEGQFSLRYQLQEGENNFTIKAEDQAGNKAETQLSVSFRF